MITFSDIFEFVSSEFQKEKIDFLLIGGFAVNFYKVSRSTDDVDFMIAARDTQRCIDLMRKLGYDTVDKHDNFCRIRSSLSKESIFVDFLFVDDDTMKELLQHSSSQVFGSHQLLVPSLNHLIALKLHAIKNNPKNRLLKDLPDICKLIENNHMSIDDEKIKSIFLKYGTESIFLSAKVFLKGL